MAHLDFKSVFDELIDESDILKYKLYKNYKTKSDINFNKPILMEGRLKMNNKKTGKMVVKHFQLCDKKMISYKISNHQIVSPNAFYDLLQFYSIYYNEYSETGLFSFTLSKYGKYHEFFSENKAEIIKWMEFLKYYCINPNFSEIFEIQQKIGKGHFAKVFQVKKKSTSDLFAAKIFTKDKAFDDEKHFVRKEVFIFKKLPKNEKILRLYEIFEDHKELILIFELLHEGDLYAKLKSKYKFTEIEISSIIAQILKGIEFLHSHGVMHRDIKLDNILLVEFRPIIKIKIADFSLAEFIKDRNTPLNKCGTPGFMAPEIFAEETYDEKIDIFSAGVVLFILLSKITPFKGKDPNEILENNKKCAIKFKRSAWENVSKTARKLCLLMLMKTPEQRITIPQIFQNEFVMSSVTYISEKNVSIISTHKGKSISYIPETTMPVENTHNSSKSNSNTKKSNNFMSYNLDQNILHLPSAVGGCYQGSLNSGSLIYSYDQNCIKSVNSIFISSSKGAIEGNSSSNMSEAFSPTHFTNGDHNAKKSLNTLTSHNFSLNGTIGKTYTMNNNNKSLHTNKTGKSSDEYSYYLKNEIFFDENPIKLLLRELDKIRGAKPHPSKKF